MTEPQADKMIVIPEQMQIIWLVGLGLSAMCFLLQMFIFIRVPSSRKVTDLKILAQITIARIANAAFGYAIVTGSLSRWALFVSMALYVSSDCALMCWMFVFSKNLYDKVTQVFTTKKITFAWTAFLIWLLSLLVGVLCPTFLYIDDKRQGSKTFDIFYKVYAFSKFTILSVNLLFFGRICYIAVMKKIGTSKGILKTCIILFILVIISSVQLFVTDLVSYFENNWVSLVLKTINSYHVLAVTYVFRILLRGFTDENIKKTKSLDSVLA